MTLSRTTSGLLAYPSFFGCDYIVFVEGGAGGHLPATDEEDTMDTMFWQRIFALSGFTGKCHFKPIGGKREALVYVDKLLHEDVPSIVVCMDRDFDHIFGRVIEHSQVLYTRGYSWENDAFLLPVMRENLLSYCTLCEKTMALCEEMVSVYQEMLSVLGRFIPWDVTLVKEDGAGLFPRDRPVRPIITDRAAPPAVDVKYLEDRVAAAGGVGYGGGGPFAELDPEKHLYGHCLARAAYHCFKHFVSRVDGNLRVGFREFARMSVGHMAAVAGRGEAPEVLNYYRGIVARVP